MLCTTYQRQKIALPLKEPKRTRSSSRRWCGRLSISMLQFLKLRVGKVMQDKPRLLIATLATPVVKGDILWLAPQLRNTKNWGNIYITPDLTKTEREAAREAREELAAR